MLARGQFHQAQGPVRARGALGRGHRVQRTVQQQVLASREFFVQAGVLEHDADGAAHRSLPARHVQPGNHGPPAGGAHKGAQDGNERGLARTVGAQQAERFPALDLQVHAIEGLEAVVILGQLFGFDGVHVLFSCVPAQRRQWLPIVT